jgi:EAL domain-containing protein (putative c-di-GMP-specific phosphodiesterase class I)
MTKARIQVKDKWLACGASFGGALLHRDGSSSSEIMKCADLALYSAKADARGTFRMFDPKLRRQMDRSKEIIAALRASVARRQIEIALQPQIEIRNGKPSGFEALARWQLAGRPISPVEFIPIAEEAGLMVDLGYQVLEKSLSALRSLRRKGFSADLVSVNVAAAQLHYDNFVETVRSAIRNFDLEPKNLEIEVTENVLLDQKSESIRRTLNAFHQLGVQIALDDFGTGFASLAHLQRFPVSRLKIDRCFVAGINEHSKDGVITRTIISLAQNLGIKVVAEGVETRDQYQSLSDYGCDYAQGFLISKPLSLNEIYTYMRAGQFAEKNRRLL